MLSLSVRYGSCTEILWYSLRHMVATTRSSLTGGGTLEDGSAMRGGNATASKIESSLLCGWALRSREVAR